MTVTPAGWRLGDSTSPGWYGAVNEMVLLMKFVAYKGAVSEYEIFKSEQWPLMVADIEAKRDELDLADRKRRGLKSA